MSEEVKPSVTDQDNAGGKDQVNEKQSTVGDGDEVSKELQALRNHKNDLLTEKKKLKEISDAQAAELQSLKEEKLKAEGKTSELNEELRAKYSKLQNDHKKMVGSFGYRCLKAEIESAATKMGCRNQRLLMLAMNEKIDKIDIDEDFKVNATQLNSVLEELKSEEPDLFTTKNQKIHDRSPTKPNTKVESNWKKQTLAEKIKMLASGEYQQE